MVRWVNIPASGSLVEEFNELAPNRDKGSDGTVGDLAHQGSTSDHNPDETGNTGGQEDADSLNEVHARDVDKDLRLAGWTMERCVQIILARCRSGAERRLRYIIFNHRIWSASDGWRERRYTGSNPHDKHAHFSFRYGSGGGQSNPENIVTGWGLLAARREELKPREDQWSEMATKQEVKDACREALSEFLWDAYNASKQTETYLKAPADDQKRMRNARDTFAAVAADDLIGAVNRIDQAVKHIVPPQAAPGQK